MIHSINTPNPNQKKINEFFESIIEKKAQEIEMIDTLKELSDKLNKMNDIKEIYKVVPQYEIRIEKILENSVFNRVEKESYYKTFESIISKRTKEIEIIGTLKNLKDQLGKIKNITEIKTNGTECKKLMSKILENTSYNSNEKASYLNTIDSLVQNAINVQSKAAARGILVYRKKENNKKQEVLSKDIFSLEIV